MKISRLISLIFLLLRQDQISAPELAHRFEVSVRTIYRDVETLSLAGIPIYTTTGRHGGIGLLPTYKVDKKLLTAADLQHLLIALGGTASLINTPAMQATIQKIQALSVVDQPILPIMIEQTNWQGDLEMKALAAQINQAIQQQQLLQFDYRDRNGHSRQRQIEPYRLVYKGERWYVQGFSLERQAYRTFRFGRMQQLQVLDTTFTPRAVTVDQLALTGQFPQAPVEAVHVRGTKQVLDRFIEHFGQQQLTQQATYFEATIDLPNTDQAVALLLGFGADLQLLTPGPLQQRLQQTLATLTGFYS